MQCFTATKCCPNSRNPVCRQNGANPMMPDGTQAKQRYVIHSGRVSSGRIHALATCGSRAVAKQGTAIAARSSISHEKRPSLRGTTFQCRVVSADIVEVKTSVDSPVVESANGSAGKGVYNSIPEMWSWLASKHGDVLAVRDPHKKPVVELTYRELEQQMMRFASGLQQLGVSAFDKVALFSENSARWIIADQGVMLLGAADAVRGATAPPDELLYILKQSDSHHLIVQDAETLKKLLPAMTEEHTSALKAVVLLWGEPPADISPLQCPVHSFQQVLEMGDPAQAAQPFKPYTCSPEQLATLVYTSGTTGHPKGVMLTHANLLYQVRCFPDVLVVNPGDAVLSLLPPWHIYERSVAYYLFACASKVVYTNIRKFKDDVTRYPPDHFICVPLVLDALYQKVMLKLNSETRVRRAIIGAFLTLSRMYIQSKRITEGVAIQYAIKPASAMLTVLASLLVALLRPLHELASKMVYSKIRTALGVRQHLICGGGSLSTHLDEFFEVIGVTVLNGWGLTETSPVLAVRRPGHSGRRNVRGTVGTPLPGTELKVVDPETYQDLQDGQKGLILARGPGIMKGYDKDEASTLQAFPIGDGWFNTGDLGWKAPAGVPGSNMAGHWVLTGRAKDTIVMSSGKNVEPQPIEDAISSSQYVKHVLVLGQDKRELGAVVFPVDEALAELALTGSELDEFMTTHLQALNKQRLDYRPYEQIAHAIVLPGKALSVDDGTLTRSMKPRRPAILEMYEEQVARLENKLRSV